MPALYAGQARLVVGEGQGKQDTAAKQASCSAKAIFKRISGYKGVIWGAGIQDTRDLGLGIARAL